MFVSFAKNRNKEMLNSVKIFFIFAVIFLVLGFTITQVWAVEYGGIGGRPAYPDPSNPRTESIFVHTVTPGQTIQNGIKVINNTAERKTLMVYAVDSAVSSGGAFACANLGDPFKSVGGWITLEKTEVTLDSLTSEVVPFTIRVPTDVSVGEHNGCIAIQEKKGASAPNDGGISLTFRTAIRVALLVPGEINRQLEIVGFAISHKANGNIILRPKVKNTGNVSIDADIKVSSRYFFGSLYKEYGGQYPILRDQASEWNFEVTKPFWGGWYKAELIVSYDTDPSAGVGIKSGQPLSVLNGPSIWFFSFPSTKGLIIEIFVLLIILVLILRFYLNRKFWSWVKKDWILYEIQTGDEINSLAKKFQISWKLLVKVNRLKPPFTLIAGQKVKVPPLE